MKSGFTSSKVGDVYLNGQTEQYIPHMLQNFCFCLKIMYCVVKHFKRQKCTQVVQI